MKKSNVLTNCRCVIISVFIEYRMEQKFSVSAQLIQQFSLQHLPEAGIYSILKANKTIRPIWLSREDKEGIKILKSRQVISQVFGFYYKNLVFASIKSYT